MICGFLRPEKNFKGLDELVAAIKQDIANSSDRLEETAFQEMRSSEFWGWDAADVDHKGVGEEEKAAGEAAAVADSVKAD